MKRSALFTTVLLIWLNAGSAGAGAVPRTIDEDGPSQGVQPLVLEEVWRVGGEDGEVIFGLIVDLKLHPDGCLYILDNQLCQVVVISPEGEHLRNLSREGDGPGELRQPVGLVFLSDEVLGVGLGFPAKLVTLGLDGTPIGTHYPVGAPAEGNVAVMSSLHFVDGVLGATGGSLAFVPGGDSYTDRFLSIGDAELAEFHHILEARTPLDPTGQVFVEADRYYIDFSWVLGRGGRVYAPLKRDAYEVSEFDTSGELQRVFGRKYKPRKRTSAEKRNVSPTIAPSTPPTTEGWVIEDHDPCITRLMVHPDDGTVWVLTPHGHEEQPDQILETWDVFSPAGEFLKQVPIPLGDQMDEGTCFLGGFGKLIVVRGTGIAGNVPVEEDEEAVIEPLEVICYRIK